MSNQTLLITGADGGLGITVTETLLAAGFSLLAATRDEQASERLANAFPSHMHRSLQAVPADLSIEADVLRFMETANGVSGLVHLAGGYTPGDRISDYSVADFDHLFALNTKPTFLLLKHVMPLFKQNGSGSIVTIGAKPALHPVSGNAVYTASKSAVIALTLSAAEEGRKHGVRANCIVPAALQTPGNLSWASKEQFDTFTPLQDVADTIAWLMSDAGKGITGTVIPMYHKMPS